MGTTDRASELAELAAETRDLLPPGTTIQVIGRHTSRSGMLRALSFYADVNGELVCLDSRIARLAGYKFNNKWDGLTVTGCGMDMGFAVVYQFSHVLYRDGFACVGNDWAGARGRCNSNDHSNGDRDYSAGRVHSGDGGYALRHRWL